MVSEETVCSSDDLPEYIWIWCGVRFPPLCGAGFDAGGRVR